MIQFRIFSNIRFIIILLGFVGIMVGSKNNYKKQKKDNHVVTVYVHGTLFSLRNVFAKIPAVADLTYVPDGLTLVKDLGKNTVARKMATLFSQKDGKRFIYSDFYAFGWSGKLSCKHREKAASFLAQELQRVSDEYVKIHGVKPILRVITFSHGGNVALNLAKYLPKTMSVELFLIACPVQNDTEDFVLADCFSKIYVIYSLHDVIQIIDPIHICHSIKERRVKKVSTRFFNYDIDKLKQVCVSVNGKYIGHFELFQMFNKHVPYVLQSLDSLPEIKGMNKHCMDIKDSKFRFLNGFNAVSVLKGKPKKFGKKDES